MQCMLGYGQQAGGTHPTGMHSCFIILTPDIKELVDQCCRLLYSLYADYLYNVQEGDSRERFHELVRDAVAEMLPCLSHSSAWSCVIQAKEDSKVCRLI